MNFKNITVPIWDINLQIHGLICNNPLNPTDHGPVFHKIHAVVQLVLNGEGKPMTI